MNHSEKSFTVFLVPHFILQFTNIFTKIIKKNYSKSPINLNHQKNIGIINTNAMIIIGIKHV